MQQVAREAPLSNSTKVSTIEDIYYCGCAIVDLCQEQLSIRPDHDIERSEALARLALFSPLFQPLFIIFEDFDITYQFLLSAPEATVQAPAGPTLMEKFFALYWAAFDLFPGVIPIPNVGSHR